MRRISARVLALVAVVAPLAIALLGARPAHASPAVDRQAWARTGLLVAPANPQDANIYVATAGGQEQARAFLHVDVSGLDTGAIAGSSVVLMPASDGMVADQASLVACSLASPLTASGELTQPPPAADCSLQAEVVRGDGGAWTLPLSVFADAWTAGHNPGLAILPNPDAGPTPFTVSLDTSKTSLDVVADGTGAAPVPSTGEAPAVDSNQTSALTLSPPPSLDLAPLPAVLTPSEAPLAAPEQRPIGDSLAPAAARRDDVGPLSAHPSTLLIVVPVLLAAGAIWARSRQAVGGSVGPAAVPAAATWKAAAWIVVPLLLMTLGESTIYNVGLVGIALIAAIGLHLLVNWTGELSLAHAGFIGVPAFAVAQFSSNTGLSPILGLPIAVVVGVVLGSLVGVAALRSRGLQVALVTLAVGIAVGQFLFFRTWVVGPAGGLQMPVPSFFGLEVRTNRALVPVLAAAVLLAVVCASSIMHSKIGRALLMVRSDPAAAAAAGIAVARHRALAYAFAGGFAGLAGWSYVVWVQQVSAKAFPLQLGFTYLVIAALAGPGGLGGVVAAAVLIQGGALFSFIPNSAALYLAPIALIVNVTRYQEGFNGVLRVTRAALESRIGARMGTKVDRGHQAPGAVRERQPLVMLGTLAVVAGFSAIGLAWYHMGNTGSVWVQNQELMSGGVAGLGLIVLGVALLLRDAVLRGSAVVTSPAVERAVLELAPTPTAVAAASNGAGRPRRRVPLAAEDAR